jgi:hypothetical protein
LPAVKLDGKLNAVALKQAQAMAATGTVSHSAAGGFSSRVAPLRKSPGGEYRRGIFDLRGNAEGVGKFSRPSRELAVAWDAPGVAFADNPKSPYRKFRAMVITD